MRKFEQGRFSREKPCLVKREKTRQWLSHVFRTHKTNMCVQKRSARVWVRPLSFAVAGRAYQSESRVVWIVVRGQKCTRYSQSRIDYFFTSHERCAPCHINQNKSARSFSLSLVRIYSTLGCRFVYLCALFVNNCHIYWRSTAALIPCMACARIYYTHVSSPCYEPWEPFFINRTNAIGLPFGRWKFCCEFVWDTCQNCNKCKKESAFFPLPLWHRA